MEESDEEIEIYNYNKWGEKTEIYICIEWTNKEKNRKIEKIEKEIEI